MGRVTRSQGLDPDDLGLICALPLWASILLSCKNEPGGPPSCLGVPTTEGLPRPDPGQAEESIIMMLMVIRSHLASSQCVPSTVFSFSLILLGRYYYTHHHTDEETEAWRS